MVFCDGVTGHPWVNSENMSGGFIQTWPKGRTCRHIPIRALGLHGNLRPLSPPRFSPRFFATCHACFGVRSSSAAWDQSLPQESYCTYGLWGWRIRGNSPNGLAHRLNRLSADLCPPLACLPIRNICWFDKRHWTRWLVFLGTSTHVPLLQQNCLNWQGMPITST